MSRAGGAVSRAYSGFDWDRCDHEGIGKPGCDLCDPMPEHRIIRLNFLLARRQQRYLELEAEVRAMSASMDRLADALSALREKSNAVPTKEHP